MNIVMGAKGFSFIELMMTLALLALLASVALPLAELIVQRNKEAELRSALRHIRNALDAYKQATDEGRIIVRPGDSGYPPKLEALVDGVEDAKSPNRSKIYFMRSIPPDPLAAPDVLPEQSWGLRSYKSTRDAPTPGDDVFDVYSLSPETGLNGIPYRKW